MDSTTATRKKDQLRLTVAICTYDRPDDLELCLSSLVDQDAPEDLFEVVVVDNGPSESTEAVTERFLLAGLPVRYVIEPRRGTTYARRTAWQVAQGDFVGYVDDDAVVSKEWVTEIIRSFDSQPAQVAMIGGPVHNVSGLTVPWPFTDSPTTGLNLGSQRRVIEDSEMLWGCNFAFRRHAMQAVNAHGEDIGPKGRRPGANEDILIQYQLMQAGYDRLYEPGMQIVHNSWRATADDRTLDRLAFWTGFDDAQMERLLNGLDVRQRGSSILSRLGRTRTQSAAWLRFRKSRDINNTNLSRRAALRSLGTISGMLWPPRTNSATTGAVQSSGDNKASPASR